MNYLKLRKPGSARAAFVFIPVPIGEIYTEVILDLDDDAIQRQLDVHEKNGYDPRRFLIWALLQNGNMQTSHERLLEVIIPGDGDKTEPCAIITNYDVFLINDKGNVVERLFRHEWPEGAVTGGGYTLQHGVDGPIAEVPDGYENLPPPKRKKAVKRKHKAPSKL